MLALRDMDLVCPSEHELREAYRCFGDSIPSVVSRLLDDTGSVTGRLGNRAFGLPTTATGTGATERYAWVGQQSYRRDSELGLYFLGSEEDRLYDPLTIRFLTVQRGFR